MGPHYARRCIDALVAYLRVAPKVDRVLPAKTAGWLTRLQANPDVELVRDDDRQPYRARVIESQRDRVNQLMAEKYGVADRIIGLMRDGGQVSAVRLDRKGRLGS